MSTTQRLIANKLIFSGPNNRLATVSFADGVNLIYGASNAGKSYTVKALDFMFGGKGPLPQIPESSAFDKVSLDLVLPLSGECSISRAMVGGAFQMIYGPGEEPTGNNSRVLSAKHDPSSDDNLSQLLLNECGFGSRYIAKDANGGKRSLSFRDIVRFCIVDETSIQSETSPAETGQYLTVTSERSALKFLLTGVDDRAIQPIENKKVFQTRTAAKVELLDEILTSLNEELTADYPDIDQLEDQEAKLERTFTAIKQEVEAGRESIRSLLSRKHQLAIQIAERTERLAEIGINLSRFEQLKKIYKSDIARLETLEEAGFLLLIGSDKDCPLCGAPPSAQTHQHETEEIEQISRASVAEIAKISFQAEELTKTIDRLNIENVAVTDTVARMEEDLKRVEEELTKKAPQIDSRQRTLDELMGARDHVLRGKSLLVRKNEITLRRNEIANLKPAAASEKPKLGVSSPVAHDFAQTISSVLTEWQFPGRRHVSFDENSYDLKIDGKYRRDNGKGVRAITHAAFKVALLQFCHERSLPHPGLVVLDTPLLTYRDPLSKEGPLSADETAIANTSLKDFFFEHLASLKGTGQFLIFENVDPPHDTSFIDHIEAFTGNSKTGRQGLF